jgi:hypothetical protein
MTNERWLLSRRVLDTEEDWLSCDLPHRMFRLLQRRVSGRKAHLFEAACFRRLWHWPEVEKRRWAVEVLERHAEGNTAPEEAERAARALREAREFTTWVMGGMWNQAFDEAERLHPDALSIAGRTAEAMTIAAGRLNRTAAGLEDGRPEEEQRAPEQSAQCELLRCIVGNPFRPVPTIARPLLTWSDSLVLKLARAAYEARHLPEGTLDTSRIAVLADALADAGCDDEGLLRHCRQPGPAHCRGCWAVDLLLGKE